jgi:prepilin signal peptidase PulO-like enzyme (type II secretory pathway)
MEFLIYFLIFIFGSVIGSFLNCLIYRLETGESFLKGRSYCPHCKHTLGWQDLIPIFSFLILKGKCRYCHRKISWQYPVVETSTAAIFLLIFNFQFLIFKQFSIFNFLNLIYYWIISSFLIVIFVYDLKHYLIPDQVIYPPIAITFIYQLLRITNYELRITNFVYGILPSLFFLTIILLSKEKWMGFGDFKLAILMGLFLGWPNILFALFLAFFIGAIIGIGLIIAGKKTLKSEIPFGPFLVSGTFLAFFFGRKILDWYLCFLLK